MILSILLAAWGAGAAGLAAPASAPAQSPDSATRARLVGARTALDDSLSAVRRVAARFGADLSAASADLVVIRAREVHERCGAAVPAADSLARLLGARTYAAAAAAEQQAARTEVLNLRRALTRCAVEFDPAAGTSSAVPDSLRAWGPYRLSRLDQATRRYEAALAAFRQKSRMI